MVLVVRGSFGNKGFNWGFGLQREFSTLGYLTQLSFFSRVAFVYDKILRTKDRRTETRPSPHLPMRLGPVDIISLIWPKRILFSAKLQRLYKGQPSHVRGITWVGIPKGNVAP